VGARKVWKKDYLKDFYSAEEDIEKIVSKRIKAGTGQRI
jgi:hypothetical protein